MQQIRGPTASAMISFKSFLYQLSWLVLSAPLCNTGEYYLRFENIRRWWEAIENSEFEGSEKVCVALESVMKIYIFYDQTEVTVTFSKTGHTVCRKGEPGPLERMLYLQDMERPPRFQ